MSALVDDVGSFPLPASVKRETFSQSYLAARDVIAAGKDPFADEFARKYFCDVVLESFRKKLQTGLDVVTYPQHLDGTKQVGDILHKAMEKGTFVADEKDTFLPEVWVINSAAKRLSEEFGKRISLRVSLYGPMEQYLKEIGTTYYSDVLDGVAETIRRLAKNSILDNKYIKTEAVSLDEPSFGFLNINAGTEALRLVLEKAFSFNGTIRQIHLHSSSRLPDLLTVKNLDVVSFEYAASPKNIDSISKRILDEADKHIRVGISRTDVDSIAAELNDKGISKPTFEQMADSEEAITRRYLLAKKKYGDRMTFTGPDCGLGGWPSQDAAQLLLTRTVKAVKSEKLYS